MPRIRKKTSKRGTTRRREKIKHKVSEHHKKAKKQARKDKATGKIVQKKSKKDPGIPNSFPYKDQVLAEVAEQRRQAAEERQRRKEEKRAASAGNAINDHAKSPTPEDMEVDEKDGQKFDGITSINKAPISKIRDSGYAEEKVTPSIPVFPGPSTLREVVGRADVILHVVDARDPGACISDALVREAQGKLVVLLNKADTVPRESLVQWLAHLRTSYTVLPFRVSSTFLPSGIPIERRNTKFKAIPKNDALGLDGLWAYLENAAQAKNSEELIVAVMGITNTGKSAIINSILGSDVLSVYDTYTAASARGPYTTTRAQEVVTTTPENAGRKVRFIDTPGLEFAGAASLTDEEREAIRARDILLRCRGRVDRLKDPMFGVRHIVTHGEAQDLMLAYNLPAFLSGDVTGFLAGLARVSRLIKKKGVLDHAGAARIVLRDWSTGKLVRYCMPGVTSIGTTEGDAEVLESVRSRKELRSAVEVKLVKMDAGVIDKRDLEWDVGWGDEEESGDEEEEEWEGVDEGDEDEDEEESDRAVGKPKSRLGKRKVSFAAVETEKRRR